MAEATLKDIVRTISETVDPEVGVSVVDLGLIYMIRKESEGGVRVEMTMTSPMCPLASVIMADVKLRLEHLPGVRHAEIDLVWDPAWSPEMINEETRVGLGV